MRSKKKPGKLSLVLAIYSLLVLGVLLMLSAEGLQMRKMRTEAEAMLVFDYAVEGYYLLLSSGSLSPREDTAYGSIPGEVLQDFPPPGNYVKITKGEGEMILEGIFQEKIRTTYVIPFP